MKYIITTILLIGVISSYNYFTSDIHAVNTQAQACATSSSICD